MADDASAPCCRICLDTDVAENLISPCRCAGTSAFVHNACLRHWIETTTLRAARFKCQQCQTSYASLVDQPPPRERPPREGNAVRNAAARVFKYTYVLTVPVQTFSTLVGRGLCSAAASGERIGCDSGSAVMGAYIAGSNVSCLLAAIIVCYCLVAHGCFPWCLICWSRPHQKTVVPVCIACMIVALAWRATLPQAVALHLLATSVIQNAVAAISASEAINLELLRANRLRFVNYGTIAPPPPRHLLV